MRPSFFIIGAPKCATTSWASYLAQHPQVAISKPKEPLYFCTDLDSKHHPYIPDHAAYEALFNADRGERVAGEATPLYLYSNEAMGRIRDYAPDSKIVILLRLQPSFIWSLHQQFLYRRIENITDPYEAWLCCTQRDQSKFEEPELSLKLLNYRAIADFKSQIDRVLTLFPPEQVFVSWMEDWKENPAWLWSALCCFIGVDDIQAPEFTRENEAKFHRVALISKLTNRPPGFALSIARFVRRVLRVKRLNLAENVRKINAGRGYQFPMTPEIEREIMEAYYEDNIIMNERLKALGCLRVPPEC